MGRAIIVSLEVERVWGRELVVVNNDQYCGKFLRVDAGACSEYHAHKVKMETLYCLAGKVEFQLEGERLTLQRGQGLTIMPGEKHSFSSPMAVTLLEVSTHHEDSETVYFSEGRGRSKRP